MSFRNAVSAILAVLAVSSCAKGTVRPDEAAPWVELDWVIVAKLSHGEFSTKLASGESLHGTYLNLTPDTPEASIEPYRTGWSSGFGSAPATDMASWREENEGRVVALLSGDRKTSMRCVLSFDLPDVGMAGGGEGTCELSTGEAVRARFSAPE